MKDPDFTQFEKNIGVHFNDPVLLKKAFTHRSYVNEHREEKIEHNERLEFLGDAVLELVITDYLFTRYPHKPEGELTAVRAALVNTTRISEAAQESGMNNYLLLSRGEAKDVGRARQIILANTFEAVIGAIYLDQGYEAARTFICKRLAGLTDEIVRLKLWQDSKSAFQECAQEAVGITPTYKTIAEEGPDHDKHFSVGVYLNNELIAEGSGHSKQEAQQDAALHALEKKGWV